MTALTLTPDHQTLIAHYRANPGVTPHYATLGMDWNRGHAACDELMEAGVLEWRKVPSKSGKTMQSKIFLTETPHLAAQSAQRREMAQMRGQK